MVSLKKQKLWLVSGMVVTAFGLMACSSVGGSNDPLDEPTATQDDIAVKDAEKLPAVPEQVFDTPVAGGEWVERVPYNAMPERFGNSGEDISVSMPIDDVAAMKIASEDDCEDYRLVEMPKTKDEKEVLKPKAAEEVKTAKPVLLRGVEISEDEITTENKNAETEDWLAPEGSSLRSLLMDWGDRAGWKIIWKSDREYILEAGAVFRGRYMDVTAALVRTFARARPAPIATFYKGNKVLLITTLEDENAD